VNRPGEGNRPIIGGGNTIVNRPGGNNNFVNINNRPGWGLGGGGHGHWADHWYGHCIPPHYHGWYHGCWSGNWGRYWYAPVVAGATAWGLSALLPSWGYSYGYTYSNPYYVESAAPVYDYSQPIVVNTYNTPTADASAESTSEVAPAPESPEMAEAHQSLDQALAAFKKGDYQTALQLDEQALRKSLQDPVMHEVSALCMFALGDYTKAAAVLNNLLAVAPGMDWTTLSGLYGNVDEYTKQLRALEAYCKQKPNDAAARFVLAYHYLVAGHSDAAARQLEQVVAAQPGDQVASRMLAALAPPAESTAESATAQQPPESSPAETGPTTDLVGSWRAERDGDVFALSIDENSQFTWKATPKGKPTVTLTGTMATAGNAILLETKDQGTMVAQVKSGGADQFQFIAAGSPPDDKGLSFQRVKQSQ
jgi:tetratricopeptide (TPR) repeat protein